MTQEDVLEATENWIRSSFIVCTHMSLWPTNQEELDGVGMWHAWGRREMRSYSEKTRGTDTTSMT